MLWNSRWFPGTNLQDINLDWILKKISALRGGGAGQYLYKKSDNDFDFGWKTGGGGNGYTFTPSVSENGVISWTNDGGLPNPVPVNIKGPTGPTGATGPAGPGLPTGGAIGQIPVKKSATNYDTEWQYPQYSRPNLLDNWYFVGGGSQKGDGVFPVNQRGQTVYTGQGAGIDRWDVSGASTTVTIDTDDADGVIFKNTASTNRFTQTVSSSPLLTGKTVTLSALCTLIDGERYAVVINTLGGGGSSATIYTTDELASVTFKIPDVATSVSAQIRLEHAGASVKIHAMKLEIGDFQTLAHQENGVWVLNELPDYAEELAECQRHYLPLAATVRYPCCRFGTGAIDFIIPTPSSMIDVNLVGTVKVIRGASYVDGFEYAINTTGPNAVIVRASKESHGLSFGDGVFLGVTQAGSALVST